MANILGAVKVAEQQELTKMPQKAASAWSGAVGQMVGATYKPVAYVGEQVVKGTNYIFLAEQTLVIAEPIRHIVAITINEFDGDVSITSIERLY